MGMCVSESGNPGQLDPLLVQVIIDVFIGLDVT